MWVIKNEVSKQFFVRWKEDNTTDVMETTDAKHYAAHYPSWGEAAKDLKNLTGSWKAMPKDEA